MPSVALAEDFATDENREPATGVPTPSGLLSPRPAVMRHATRRNISAPGTAAETATGLTHVVDGLTSQASDVLPAQEDPPPLDRATLRVPATPPKAGRSILLQQWEGTVVAILDEEFSAITRDLVRRKFPEEQVTLLLEDVPVADRDLVRPGAVFYWTISYEEDEYGTRTRGSRLRFRRLPAWSRRDVDRAHQAAKELSRFFDNG